MEELTGKVAVVTGGASGIGLALGLAFAGEGMKVVLADIEVAALEKAAAEYPEGAEVLTVVCDVADPAQVDALRDAAVDRFGAVHVVCNNAGVSTGGPVWEQSLDDWHWTLGVNLYGVVHGIRSFVPLMIEQGEGHVVNTASMAGLSSPPTMAIYNVTKHAVVTLTETLYADLAMAGHTGVGTTVLCPGWVDTRINTSSRNRPTPADSAPREATEQEQLITDYVGKLLAEGLAPADVAAMVVEAVKARRFYVLTHPDWTPMVTDRTARIANGEDPLLDRLPV